MKKVFWGLVMIAEMYGIAYLVHRFDIDHLLFDHPRWWKFPTFMLCAVPTLLILVAPLFFLVDAFADYPDEDRNQPGAL